MRLVRIDAALFEFPFLCVAECYLGAAHMHFVLAAHSACLGGVFVRGEAPCFLPLTRPEKRPNFGGRFKGPKIGQESVNPNCWGSHFAALFWGRKLAPKLGPCPVAKFTAAGVPAQPCRS